MTTPTRRPDRPKATPISIKVDPRVLAAFKAAARQRGMGYQTLMNKVLAGFARRQR